MLPSLYSVARTLELIVCSTFQVSAEEAGKAMVRDLVHNFLIDLCCSRKHGICFYDASLGTSGR